MFTACACAIWLHLVSYHTQRDVDWNEINPGLFVEKNNVIVGAYRNSYSRTSALGAYRFNLVDREAYSVDLMVGGVSGYPRKFAAILSIGVGQHARIQLVPPTSSNSGVISLAWKL